MNRSSADMPVEFSAVETSRSEAPPAGPGLLREIIRRNAVWDGSTWVDLHSHVSTNDGTRLQQLIRSVNAANTLEVGMAYGISTLFICEALAELSTSPRHVAIDPFQHQDWKGIALANVRHAGFENILEFHEARSEYVLPSLAVQERRFDFALIDGWHSFDQAMVEFFYLSRMVRVGGIIAFDDSDWPGINKLLRFLVTLPAFEVVTSGHDHPPRLTGRVRRAVGDTTLGRRALHPSVRRRRWDLGINDRLVAIRKIAEDTRDMKWFEDF